MNTLEQELQARTFMHKVAVVGGALMQNYIVAHSKGVQLPLHIIQDQADEYSNKVMQHALKHGTFDDLYNRVWESLKDVIPDDLNLVERVNKS